MPTRKISDIEHAIHLGISIREFRTSRGLSQDDVAEALGCSRTQISKYELGQNAMTVFAFVKLSDHFGVKPCEILGCCGGNG